jgi:hypothetical protein
MFIIPNNQLSDRVLAENNSLTSEISNLNVSYREKMIKKLSDISMPVER